MRIINYILDEGCGSLSLKRTIASHIDGNGLNNQRYNLRICTKQENLRNQKPIRGGSSKFKGVYLSKAYPKYGIKSVWRANIGKDGKAIFLGGFENEIDAAKAYDRAALKYFGEFARVNFSTELRGANE